MLGVLIAILSFNRLARKGVGEHAICRQQIVDESTNPTSTTVAANKLPPKGSLLHLNGCFSLCSRTT
jgi:hypothetical protein